ncbi:rhoGAP_ARAP and RA_ARAPs domain-containing protein RhoGAP15B [Arctopsyche grandis]|uniref:rhoGAP_ARAP and RA_ARAPs domain-containing protein RhoGAP15B n=1 Tax=Arctopsyche grandis TaxID=121162 RepID=UPI00406D77D9
MDPPVPKKRQEVMQIPVPAPRRHLPPALPTSDVPTSSNSDNRSSIVGSALVAKDKINKGMLLGAKLAKQVVEQGMPGKKLNVKPPSKIVVTNPLEEVAPPDLSVFEKIRFHSPMIENQDSDEDPIYSYVEFAKRPQKKDDSNLYDIISFPSQRLSHQINDAFESASSSDNFSNALRTGSANTSFNDLTVANKKRKEAASSKNQYENFHLNIPPSNYESLHDYKTPTPKAVKQSHVNDLNPSNEVNAFPILKYEHNSENIVNLNGSNSHVLDSNANAVNSLFENPLQPRSSNDFANFNLNLPSKIYNDSKKYENFTPTRNTNKSRSANAEATKSTILEFDPILKYDTAKSNKSKTNEMLLMEAFLLGFCNDNEVNVDDNLSEASENELFGENSDIYMSPPTPPERNDSLNVNTAEFKDELFKSALNESSTKPEWFLYDDMDPATTPSQARDRRSSKSNVFMKRFSSMLKIVPETATQIKKRFDIASEASGKIEKPPMSGTNISHRGNMMRSLSAPMEELFKNHQMRLCVLSNQILYCYSDSTSSSVKETYNLKSFYSIQVIKILSANCHHFQITYYNPSLYSNRNTITFGCYTPTERSEWMMKIVQVATTMFPTHLISNYTRFGWCYLKGNISQQWESGWILLARRFIYYHTTHDTSTHDLDLRKAKSVVLQKEDGDVQTEDGPAIILDFQNQTLYLKMGCSAETKMWKRIIKTIAINNGRCLHQQQLTKDDIPVIVQKCINFVCCYGSLSVGIYRRSGRLSAVNSLLELFNKDAWAHHLSDKDFCEHDIAAVLKAFFRNLPEPLIPVDFQAPLCRVSDFADEKKKVDAYQKILSKLQVITRSTLKVIIGHLNFISSFSDENLMNVENISSIWTPTLIPSCDSDASSFQRANQVIKDLIYFYVRIYNPSDLELQRESSILNVLRKYKEINTPIPQQPSGQFHVWIRIDNGKEEDVVNVSVGPTQTCGDICLQLSSKVKMEPHTLCLEEVVCEQKLRRPIHHSEIVLDVVFNWGNWDQCDRKENSLLLCENKFLKKISNIQKHMVRPVHLKKEFKYADDKTKTFKTCTFELTESLLRCYKGKNSEIVLEDWKIRDVRWYIGHESKRNPNSEWSITLLKHKNKCSRSKGRPWFGHIIAGQNMDDMRLLIACFLHSKHPHDLIPDVQLVVT